MKKFFQFLTALVIISTLLLGFFQLVPGSGPDVGWNSGPSGASLQVDDLAACRTCSPPYEKLVGWNS